MVNEWWRTATNLRVCTLIKKKKMLKVVKGSVLTERRRTTDGEFILHICKKNRKILLHICKILCKFVYRKVEVVST